MRRLATWPVLLRLSAPLPVWPLGTADDRAVSLDLEAPATAAWKTFCIPVE